MHTHIENKASLLERKKMITSHKEPNNVEKNRIKLVCKMLITQEVNKKFQNFK